LVAKVKPNTNSVEVHPQLSNNRHPVDDGALMMGAGFTVAVRGAAYRAVSFAIFAGRFQINKNAHCGWVFHFLKRPPLFVHSFFSAAPYGYHTKNT
jgi:hypothetical protein